MNLQSMFDRDGYVKLPPKVGNEPVKPPKKRQNMDDINFCLNCGKKNCKHGNCKERMNRNDV